MVRRIEGRGDGLRFLLEKRYLGKMVFALFFLSFSFSFLSVFFEKNYTCILFIGLDKFEILGELEN